MTEGLIIDPQTQNRREKSTETKATWEEWRESRSNEEEENKNAHSLYLGLFFS